MEKISLPVRIFAIAIVLVGLAGMLALRTMGPSDEIGTEPIAAPAPVRKAAVTPLPKVAKTPAVASKPAATPKAATPKVQPEPVVNPVVPPTGFPLAVDRALRKHRILVVSLVVPGARVDELAAAEARAGAKLGGAGFLALNVLNERVARTLFAKVEAAQDPSVLVLTRSGEVAVELTGFVDRETVAQAATNASA